MKWRIEQRDDGGAWHTRTLIEAETWHEARTRFTDGRPEIVLGVVAYAGGAAAVEAFVMSPAVRCTPAP